MLKFFKMQGAGNDYIYIDCFAGFEYDPGKLAVKLSDRNFGVGGDGLVLIYPSDNADCKMDMYNADGSRGNMCGNAIRCVGKYMYDQGKVSGSKISVDTLSGIKELDLHIKDGKVSEVTVDMGKPVLEPSKIPVNISEGDLSVMRRTKVGEDYYYMTFVSMGNPHAVIFTDSAEEMDISVPGRIMEKNSLFPEGINTEFARINPDGSIFMRVWERGSGETLACGTGACAVLVAGVLTEQTKREAVVDLRGGRLHINWDEKTGHVFMRGPAKTVFWGYVVPEEL